LPLEAFRNEPFLDLHPAEEIQLWGDAVAQVRSRLGADYPVRVGGREQKWHFVFESRDPADPVTVVGRVHMGAARSEIVGPFLSVLRAQSLQEELEVANSVEYALTGAVFSTEPKEPD
jgi:hypothetical protein